MNTLHVSITDEMLAFVQGQAAEGGFPSPDEYLRALIQDAQVRAAKRRLEARFQEALDSGPSEDMTDEDWEGIEAGAMVRLG